MDDFKEEKYSDQVSATSENRSRGRGRRHQRHSNYSVGQNHHSRNSQRFFRGTRGTFRSRTENEIEQDDSATRENSSYTGNSQHASKYHDRKHHRNLNDSFLDSRQNRREWQSRRKRDNTEDPVAIEKEQNKLSLLDGIEQMYKKPTEEGIFDACSKETFKANDHNSASNCQKFLEDVDDLPYSKGGDKYHQRSSRRPQKWLPTHGVNRRDFYGKDGTYRNYSSEALEGNSEFESNNYRKQDYKPRQYHSKKFSSYKMPSAPSYTEVFIDSAAQSEQNDQKGFTDNNYGAHHSFKHSRNNQPFRQETYPNDSRRREPRHYKPQNVFGHRKHNFNQKVTIDDDATQREMLTEQLQGGDFECSICCEAVRHRDPIWSCLKCFNIFHFHCIRKWGRTATAIVEGLGWRCPTCQDIYESIPHSYYCFCGKVRDPEMNRHDTPHSCGQVCGRSRQTKDCQHRCNILCHPGPCPPCNTLVTRSCECKKIEMQIRCGRTSHITCEGICEKVLNCGLHKCKEKCHAGPCNNCTEMVKQDCFCSKAAREIECTKETALSSSFSCGKICEQKLGCGKHYCQLQCHSGQCPTCKELPGIVTNCSCGKTTIKELLGGRDRTSCTDPIPTCSKVCEKLLMCGPEDDRHHCYAKCHLGKCPPCPLKTSRICLCGSINKEYWCKEIESLPTLRCEKRCNRKKQCLRHKCLNTCCIDLEHVCEFTCNRKLTCGLHQCPEPCHKGNCKTCSNVSFEDLTCYCGAQILLAPIACGTQPPHCDELCVRQHSCDHPIQHPCHNDPECPPCTAFTEKWCFGAHEKRTHVPCHIRSLSCGLPCNKPLSCRQHVCHKVCHESSCETDGSACVQPCVRKRLECDHICGAPCHQGPCPKDFPCKTLIKLSCKCGTRLEEVPCGENAKLFKQVSASVLASMMQDIQLGNSIDISGVFGNANNGKTKHQKIECNEDCAHIERNKRLALALQIRNPDLSTNPGPPKYSDFLRDETKKSPLAVKTVHDKLTELVQLAKQSKQKSRSHSFPAGNRDQRRIIHELSEFFGCESESFDQEPKRNVVVTAFRDRSYLPSCSVMTVVQREMGIRSVPLPALSNSQRVASANSPLTKSTDQSQAKATVDYFDY